MAMFFEEQGVPVTPGGINDVPTPNSPSINRPKLTFEKEAEPLPPVLQELFKSNPDKAAKSQRVAREKNLPLSTVSDNPDAFDQIDRFRDIDEKTKDAPATRRFISNPVNATMAHDDVENLSAIEQISRSYRIGKLTRELGIAGSNLRANQDEASRQRVQNLQERLTELGYEPEGGFVQWLSDASEVAGQWIGSLASPRTQIGIAGGATIGVTLGAAGGPFTAAGGMVAGGVAGGVSYLGWDAFEVEGGLAYIDMLEMGIDQNVATYLSAGVGTVNAALELAGATVLARPITEATKQLMRGTIRDVMTSPRVIGVAASVAKEYGGVIVAETSTEVLQELVNIAAEEWGKALSDTDFETITQEELTERLEEIALKTVRATAVLGLPGAGVSTVRKTRNAYRATKNADAFDQINEKVLASKTFQRDPEKAGEHVNEIIREAGIAEVFIPGEQLANWINAQEDPDTLLDNLGVADQISEAVALGQDVSLTGEAFAKHILTSSEFSNIADHIRESETGLTPAEALEYTKSGFKEDLDAAIEAAQPVQEGTREAVEPPMDPDVKTAAADIGMKAMFRTAKEAGMTPDRYQKYLDSINESQRQAAKDLEERALKREQRKLTAEYKVEQKKMTEKVEAELLESVSAYATREQLSGLPRLDRDATEAALKEIGMNLSVLPKHEDNKVIYATTKGEPVSHPEEIAQLYGYADAKEMLVDLVQAVPFKEAVQAEVDARLAARTEEIKSQEDAILEARQALLNDAHLDVLVTEMNALKERERQAREEARKARGRKPRSKDRKPKKLTSKLVKIAARDRLSRMTMKNIRPELLLAAANRAGQKAGQAIRKNDQGSAQLHKFQQVVNYQMAREAFRMSERLKRQRKELAKYRKGKQSKNLPTEYLDAINGLMDQIGFLPKPGKKKLAELQAVANRKSNPARVSARLLDAEKPVRWEQLTLKEFENLYQTVKEIEHKGLQNNKLARETEKKLVEEQVAEVVEQIDANLTPERNSREALKAREQWNNDKKWGPQIRALLYTAESVVRFTDGLVNLGPTYRALKGRYDQAMSEGYHEGSIGYLRRRAKEAKRIKELFAPFSKADRRQFDKLVDIPGMNRRITNHERIAVLLNMGNRGNIEAMLSSGTVTAQEMAAIQNHASQKDWDFAQSVWDYLEEFFPEVVKAEQRRRNYTPEKVEAQAIDTQFGTYRGGYYPIKYKATEGAFFDVTKVEEMVDKMKYGSFVSSHTQRGHTESRAEATGKAMMLDMFVINQHVDQVIYDLEVGDALTDIYKVLYHPDLKKAYANAGHNHYWENLDLWFRDVLTGEIGKGHAIEKGLRWVRTGLTISRLGWNLGVIALQVLGVSQSAVQINKKHMWSGLRTVLGGKWYGQDTVFEFPGTQSGMMETRRTTFDKDIHDAEQLVRLHFLDKITPGNTAGFIRDTFFWGIKKTQGFTDTVTWYAGLSEGMELFDGDREKAILHADRMVARTQASGVFGDRTAFERGSIRKDIRQTEIVRAFTPFISYFMAKTNVTAERLKKFQKGKKNPATVIGLVTDLMMIYTVEAILAGLIRGQWPDPDDREDDWFSYVAAETFSSITSGIPLVREAAGAILGFQGTGGVIGNVGEQFGNVAGQWSQGEIDKALLKSTNNLGGVLLKYPSSQINKTGEAAMKYLDGEDVTFLEFLMGPKFDR